MRSNRPVTPASNIRLDQLAGHAPAGNPQPLFEEVHPHHRAARTDTLQHTKVLPVPQPTSSTRYPSESVPATDVKNRR